MKDGFVEIVTADGAMDAFVTHPEEGGPFPAVIIYMDIWGVREELYDIARGVGTVGYCCVVPDLYYRQGRRIHFDFRNERNQTISRDRLEGEKLRAILARPQLTNTDGHRIWGQVYYCITYPHVIVSGHGPSATYRVCRRTLSCDFPR